MPSYQTLAPDRDIREQSLIASHTNPSKFVLVPSVWNQLKIRQIYMGSIKLSSFIFRLGITIKR